MQRPRLLVHSALKTALVPFVRRRGIPFGGRTKQARGRQGRQDGSPTTPSLGDNYLAMRRRYKPPAIVWYLQSTRRAGALTAEPGVLRPSRSIGRLKHASQLLGQEGSATLLTIQVAMAMIKVPIPT